MTRPRKVYVINFTCYKAEPAQICSTEIFMELSSRTRRFTKESLDFQRKILERSGFGEKTYAPKALMQIPFKQCMDEARKETETVMFGAINELFAKTGIKPRDIGILVVNSSLFNPTPSLSATIVNHYKFKGNILSYNLGGMGCSAGLISIDLVKELFQVHPNCYALVVSTENLTQNWYFGNNRSMLLTNCLFRVGGAAILLSNRSSDHYRAKYQLFCSLRTQNASDDKSFNCVLQKEDESQKVGIELNKDLKVVAGEALKTNITTLGPLVLPMFEQLRFLINFVARKFLKMKMIRPYVPNFKLAFEHFCIHTGGKSVLDEIEKSLKLDQWHMEPSRMTLYRYGNTSSSSLWYELAYCEAKGRINKGDRVWQIGFGSGFKCNSVVWYALNSINSAGENNPWNDELKEFPIQSAEIIN
ncbi:3-ketoacyl-CoA synthase 20-like [Carica papaya]|uniref:3-ketoacyl-CoA synthase 20-like n=1 Tax=Carica papaya TaxID=3649 RepID=UPI000B8CFF2A|nr:3-ketoacyl-CoA synthase 20-like [Carica papaya]